MPFLSFFRSDPTSPDSYEKALSETSRRIQQAQRNMSLAVQRSRRVLALWTVYSLLAYSLFLAIFILRRDRGIQGWATAVLGPPLIYGTRRMMRWYYTRRIGSIGGCDKGGNADKTETKVEHLKSQQREKVEELKRKTRFYSTQSLLERYAAEGSNANSSLNPSVNLLLNPSANTSNTPNTNSPVNSNTSSSLNQNPNTPLNSYTDTVPVSTPTKRIILRRRASQPQPLSSSAWPLPRMHDTPPEPLQAQSPVASTWYDRVLDILVGVDESAPSQRHALICISCRSHNGLAPFSQPPETVAYSCPHCGSWNGPREETANLDQNSVVVAGEEFKPEDED
ncbi:Protein lunapark [Neolecta irregularis DAH-3]|uniref:Endoplasmic reticulum junction formation protein lunapark n=1 Tax=Neolecta irregularis (strain DAH-3) TaxID=1198029 RepID=A0A1U7LQN2_NEOID|nr:Protein lunapark [Neolecta irregularis DAH-3]|eukprot:OLL24967.1 Protein lunapark [Neolecta irregularis DAH-3]